MEGPPIPQKPAEWYTTIPLRGNGKNGNLKDEDFLSALQISVHTYRDIRSTCMSVLDQQAEYINERIDLRTRWKGRDGPDTKSTMLSQLIHAFPDVFDDTARLTYPPPNWGQAKMALAEAFFTSTNAYRSRQLHGSRLSAHPGTENNIRELSPPNLPTSVCRNNPIEHRIATRLRPQPPSFGTILLNNIIITVTHDDGRMDILPRYCRKSDGKLGEPHFIDDVSFEKLANIVAKKLKSEGPFQIWGLSSTGSMTIIQSDDDLVVALIMFIGIVRLRDGYHTTALEIRSPSRVVVA
jgi:hypothetical protein